MLTDNKASIVLLVVGIGILSASLLADFIGIGDSPGFGKQQTMGTIAGLLVTAVGLYFTFRKSTLSRSESQDKLTINS